MKETEIIDWTPEEVDRIELLARDILIALPRIGSGAEAVAALVTVMELILEQADPDIRDVIRIQIRKKFASQERQH